MLKTEESGGLPCKFLQDNGDSLLWAALCMAAKTKDWRYIARNFFCAQDEQSGRFYRNPLKVKVDETLTSFSRDMAAGLVLGIAASIRNDKTYEHFALGRLQHWIDYVIQNKYRMFPESADGRHLVSPPVLWMASYLGAKVPTWIRLTRWLHLPYLYFCSYKNKPGYQLHLVAVSLFFHKLLAEIRYKKTSALYLFSTHLLFKRQPKNPFFAWLAGVPFEYYSGLLKRYLEEAKYNNQGTGNQWSWERDTQEYAWLDSCGWDFYFMYSLLGIEDDAA